MAQKPDNIEKYQNHYSENSFFDKLKNSFGKAGKFLVAKVLMLYYAKDNMSAGEKALVIGVLGYFILPVDLIPDLYPVVGFTDDLAALAYVITAVKHHIGPDAKQKARIQMQSMYGHISEDEFRNLGL